MEWVAHFLLYRVLSNPGFKPVSSAVAGGFFTTEPPGKPFFLITRNIVIIIFKSNHIRESIPETPETTRKLIPKLLLL